MRQKKNGRQLLSFPLPHPPAQTELCRTWLAGATCVYGDRCVFAHGAGELRAPVSRLGSRGSGGGGCGGGAGLGLWGNVLIVGNVVDK